MAKKKSLTATAPSRQRKRTVKPLPRQRDQKVVSQPVQMARAEILVQLKDTIAACDGLFQAHGEACSCDLCCLVSNFVGAVRVFRMLVEIT